MSRLREIQIKRASAQKVHMQKEDGGLGEF